MPGAHRVLLNAIGANMILHLIHFGPLRDQRGCAQESLDVVVTTPRELYACCGFTLAETSIAVAVNDDVVAWDQPLASGDTVIFLPPVSGG